MSAAVATVVIMLIATLGATVWVGLSLMSVGIVGL